jgi:hypothetical protein
LSKSLILACEKFRSLGFEDCWVFADGELLVDLGFAFLSVADVGEEIEVVVEEV